MAPKTPKPKKSPKKSKPRPTTKPQCLSEADVVQQLALIGVVGDGPVTVLIPLVWQGKSVVLPIVIEQDAVLTALQILSLYPERNGFHHQSRAEQLHMEGVVAAIKAIAP